METDKRAGLERKLLYAMCELKTMHPLSTERSRSDGWIEGETMQETDREREGEGERGEKERESDA